MSLWANFEITVNANTTNTTRIIAISDGKLFSIFDDIKVPTGWHKEYRITSWIATAGDTMASLTLNGKINTNVVNTWSSAQAYLPSSSSWFKETDVPAISFSIDVATITGHYISAVVNNRATNTANKAIFSDVSIWCRVVKN